MTELRKHSTLFEIIPALGTISAHGGGTAKLMPVGFDHPGFELVEGINKVGRDPGQNHHVILSSHVSRTHCELLLSGGKIWARDLGSHNGTYVNGERVTERELQPGDKVGISRRVTFVLVMDPELQQPFAMDVQLNEPAPPPGKVSPLAARPAPAIALALPAPVAGAGSAAVVRATPPPTSPVAGMVLLAPTEPRDAAPFAARPAVPSFAPAPLQVSAAADGVEQDEAELDQSALLKQVEQQRNVLAILYQVSLRCLMVDSPQDVEQLLTNVLQRLVPLDAGFILYQTGGAWHASICPGSKQRPADTTVRAFYHLAARKRGPLLLVEPEDLQPLGLTGGSALVVPLLHDDKVSGVVGMISAHLDAYTPETLDIVMQLANVSAAALRDRLPPA